MKAARRSQSPPGEDRSAPSGAGWRRAALSALVVSIAFAVPLWSTSGAGGADLFGVFGGLFALVVALACWIVRLVQPLSSRQRPHLPILEPLLVAAILALWWRDVPFRSRFALSEGALRRYALGALNSSSEPVVPHRAVGLYRVQRVERLPGRVVRVVTEECGFGDHAGFVYSPAGPPPVKGEDSYTHLRGPWYRWYESW